MPGHAQPGQPTDQPIYKRLPGVGRRLSSRFFGTRGTCRLWLGPDHLLQVQSTIGSESYKRFYFRDIEAIHVRETNWLVWELVTLAAAAGLCLLGTLIPEFGVKVFFGTAAVFFVAWLLIHLIVLGRTCKCFIQTAVQVEDLVSLRRIKLADKLLARVVPLIVEAQTLVEIQSPEALAEAVALAVAPAPPLVGQEDPAKHELDLSYTGRPHLALFSLLLASALAAGLALAVDFSIAVLLAGILMGVGLIALVVALMRQRRAGAPWGLQLLSWSIVPYAAACGIWAYAYYMIMIFEQLENSPNATALMAEFLARSVHESATLSYGLIAVTALSGIVGTVGLVMTRGWLARRKTLVRRPVDQPRATPPLPAEQAAPEPETMEP